MYNYIIVRLKDNSLHSQARGLDFVLGEHDQDPKRWGLWSGCVHPGKFGILFRWNATFSSTVQQSLNLSPVTATRIFIGEGHSPGSLGRKSPTPTKVQGRSLAVRDLWGEIPQKLKQIATLLTDVDCRYDQNLKISHNSPPDSWPVCFTVEGWSTLWGFSPQPTPGVATVYHACFCTRV